MFLFAIKSTSGSIDQLTIKKFQLITTMRFELLKAIDGAPMFELLMVNVTSRLVVTWQLTTGCHTRTVRIKFNSYIMKEMEWD